MPTDSRRLPVPEVSHSPELFCSSDPTSLINDDSLRKDGRNPEEIAGIFMQCGTVSQAKGSSFCELHKTKVICSVYGPKDVEQKEDFQMIGKLKCDFKFAPFSCHKRRGHIADLEESELCEVLTQALSSSVCLHRYPKSQIEVYVIVLENNGSALAAAITAASLALADACIEQYDIVAAASVRVFGKENFLRDPTFHEEYFPHQLSKKNDFNNGVVTVALMPTLNQVCGVLSEGCMESSVLQEAIQTCTEEAQNPYAPLRKCLTSNLGDINV